MTTDEIRATPDKIKLLWEFVQEGSVAFIAAPGADGSFRLKNQGFFVDLHANGTWTLVETGGR